MSAFVCYDEVVKLVQPAEEHDVIIPLLVGALVPVNLKKCHVPLKNLEQFCPWILHRWSV
jgi:hypothetical protein